MIYLNKETELTVDLLSKMIKHFRTTVEPRLQKYKNYYDGVQKILQKSYADPSKPCNKTVINYCKNITDCYTGYIATPGHISYRSDNDIEEIMDILRYNDYQAEDCEFLQDLLVYGTSCELMYMDSDSKTRFRLINPLSCFGIFDDSLTGDLLYFVRMYKENDWDNSNTYIVDVYSDTNVKKYTMQGLDGALKFMSEDPHYFSQCPANISTLPDEKNIFECIIGIQDSINELLSAEVDDYQAFCDAYLVLTGAELDNETTGKDGLTDAQRMRTNRILDLPEGATAAWLTKQANDAQIENMLKRLHDSAYRIAQCPDFSSESFVGGVSSGIAIQYRLTGMETKAGKIESIMKKALQRRIEIICGIASLKLGEEVFRDIDIEFKRNIPEDITNTINIINSLKGIISDATLLTQIPFVEDVNAELEALQKQKEENMALYSFGNPSFEDDEEESDVDEL